MPAATTLFEAKNFALQNVWGKFRAPSLLKTSLQSWVNDGLIAVLDPNQGEQAEALGWTVPSQYVNSILPNTTGEQNERQVAELIELLSRTIERLENITLTAGQISDIIDAYNAAWA